MAKHQNPTIIYGVCDPRTGELRYVGKTSDTLKRRLVEHLWTKDTDRTHRGYWFRKLKKDGITPDIFEIETIAPGACWKAAECFWIAYFRSIGCRLVNQSKGGGGGTGALTVEHRAAISRANKHPLTDEHKAAIGRANKGRPSIWLGKHLPEETKKKIGDANRGKTKVMTPEWRANISKGHIGLVKSEETCARLSTALTGKPKSAKHKRNLSIAMQGKTLTDEHKEKLSKAGKGRVKSAEWRKRIGYALRGRVVSEETRKRIGEARRAAYARARANVPT